MTTAATKIKDNLKKYGFIAACFLCFVFCFLSMWLKDNAVYVYLAIVVVSAVFFDINKLIILCSLSCMFENVADFWSCAAVVCFCLVVGLIKQVIKKEFKLSSLINLLFPIIVILFLCADFFFNDFSVKSIKHFFQVPLIYLSIVLAYSCRKQFDMKAIIRGVTILFIATCALTIPFILTKRYSVVYHIMSVKRYKAFFLHENVLSTWIIMLLFFQLFMIYKNRISLVEFITYAVPLSVVGFTTESKTFLICSALFLILYLVKMYVANWRNAIKQTIAILVALFIFYVAFYDKISHYISRFWIYSSDNSSFWDRITTDRVKIWKQFIDSFTISIKTILIGNGGTFDLSNLSHAHNSFINIVVRYGLVGFCLMLLSVLYLVFTLRNEKHIRIVDFLPTLALVMIMMVEVFNDNRCLLIILGIAVLFATNSSNDSKIESPNGEKARIPKIIHYIWFGGSKFSPEREQLIESWKKLLPDYKFILWSEKNFEISKAPKYVQEAYEKKKYAFVSDYVRLFALYTYGGVYMDTDVVLVKSFDKFLDCKMFLGREDSAYLSAGVIGARKNDALVKILMEEYNDISFIKKDGSRTYKNRFNYDLVNSNQNFDGYMLYRREFFSPKSYVTERIAHTKKTVAIHMFENTWGANNKHFIKVCAKKVLEIFPVDLSNALIDEYKKLRFVIKTKE